MHTVSREHSSFAVPIDENNKFHEVLADFLPILEKLYPKTNLETRESILGKITKILA